jgi:serine/threonine protein kinase
MAIVLKTCLRACYDPHSKYLEDHYVLGETLGKGAFGEVRKARLKWTSHLYSQEVVGGHKDEIVMHQHTDHKSMYDVDELADSSKDNQKKGTLKKQNTTTINEQRRANLDKTHGHLHQTSEWPFACKILKKANNNSEQVLREISILDACQHKNVMLMVEFFNAKRDIYVVLGRCYGDAEMLHNHEVDGIPLPRVMHWARDMAKGVAHIHSLEVCHRDIKLPNLLLDSPLPDSGVVLGDFGFAEYEEFLAREDADICGTPLALSPEVFDGGFQTRTSDLWAMGITVYEMVAHEHPFSNPVVQKEVAKLLNKQHEEVPDTATNTAASKTEKHLDHHKDAHALYKASTFKRQEKGDKITSHMSLHATKERHETNPHVVRHDDEHMREPNEFYTVASRFSTNARFVQKFEELAVAVTSEPIQPRFSHKRFKPEFKDITSALLERDSTKRITAAGLVEKCEGLLKTYAI